jgi:hypothetical protein
MGRIYKYIGNYEGARELWENRESLEKYLKALKHLMMSDPNSRMYDGETEEDARERASIYNRAIERGIITPP